jgi:pimeloyl-ACP methyl ester carboxylesterase
MHIESLAQHNHVLALDHRGHGLSSNVGSLEAYSIQQIADDLVALLDTRGGAPVTILGHSLGGRVALQVAIERPDLVCSLILMDTSAWSFQPSDSDICELIADVFRGLDPTNDPAVLDIRMPEDELIEVQTTVDWRERRKELKELNDPFAVKALGIELFANGITSLRDKLSGIHCPVTVIVGSLDEPYVGQAPDLAAETGGSLEVIDGAYHSPQLTHPSEWQRVVESHLVALR